MIPDFTLQITFRKSHSKFYSEVISLCKIFKDFKKGDVNILNTNRDEVYAHWGEFNLIFWKTVDWRGATLAYNGNVFGDHSDKTRIFYAVQDNRLNHLCSVINDIQKLGKGVKPIDALSMYEVMN